QRLGRQAAKPHWQIGGGRHLCEGSPFDREIERPRRIEPGPWYGEREQKRRKAHGEVCNARMAHRESTHRPLESGTLSLEPTLHEIRMCGAPGTGPQEFRSHVKSRPQTRARRPLTVSIE